MSGRASYLLYGLLAVAVGAWLIGQLGSERRRITKRLERLAELIEKDGAENNLIAANKARTVGLLFARDFEIDLQGRAQGLVSERSTLAQVMMRYRSAPSRIELAFTGVEIEVGEGGGSADMSAVAAATATSGGDPQQRRFRLALRWLKEDGEWMIQRAELIEELAGPALF